MATAPADPSSPSSPPASTAPPPSSETVALTCLLISGKRHTFRFPAGATIRQTKQQIYQEWPKEWESDKPDSPGFLRLLYLGKVLEDPRGLADYQLLPARKPTIVHLTIKMVEDPDVPVDKRDPEQVPKCHCTIF